MSLRFPEVKDLPLQRSPISDVICQVRFPPILSIVSRDPADFQERVRHRFPGFEKDVGFSLDVTPGMGFPSLNAANSELFRFLSLDRRTTVTLTSSSIALSTSDYSSWPNFASDLAIAIHATSAEFEPDFCTRIGLRYINTITCRNTKLETLSDLVQVVRPELLSLFSTDAWKSSLETSQRVVVEDPPGKLVLQTAIAEAEGEPVIYLDIDYFEEGQFDFQEVASRGERYHDIIYRAFRWSLADDGLAAFEPH